MVTDDVTDADTTWWWDGELMRLYNEGWEICLRCFLHARNELRTKNWIPKRVLYLR